MGTDIVFRLFRPYRTTSTQALELGKHPSLYSYIMSGLLPRAARHLYDTSVQVPNYFIKREMVLEQLDKVWLNRRVRANPHGKFVLSKKVKVLAEAAPSGK